MYPKRQRGNGRIYGWYQQPKKWYLVANKVGASIFQQGPADAQPFLLEEIRFDAGRMHNQDLKEGRPGRSFSSWAQSRSRHTMDPHFAAKELEARRFARALGERLRLARIHRQFTDLILVAEPRFLGLVTSELDHATARCLRYCVGRDLGNLSAARLRERVAIIQADEKLIPD